MHTELIDIESLRRRGGAARVWWLARWCGHAAAHNILAMGVAGCVEPALYPGSWSEWIRDPERPVAP